MKHLPTMSCSLLIFVLSVAPVLAGQGDTPEAESQTSTRSDSQPEVTTTVQPPCPPPGADMRRHPDPNRCYHQRLAALRAARRPALEKARLALLAKARAEQLPTNPKTPPGDTTPDTVEETDEAPATEDTTPPPGGDGTDDPGGG